MCEKWFGKTKIRPTIDKNRMISDAAGALKQQLNTMKTLPIIYIGNSQVIEANFQFSIQIIAKKKCLKIFIQPSKNFNK